MSASRPFSFSHRSIVVAVLFVGVLTSVISYRLGTLEEQHAAESDFQHRAALRHALVREILGHYEDALFGWSAVFAFESELTRAQFVEAAQRLEGRLMGVQAYEWVPLVPQARRAAVEAAQPAVEGRGAFQFIELSADRTPRRAAERPYYYPIVFVHPLQGNEAAVGFDLMTGPTRELLEQARASRQIKVSPPIRLVQEIAEQPGIVMVVPVYRERSASAKPLGGGEPFVGFLQCVFRVHDLLATAHSRQPVTTIDMLFVDRSEPDPAKRILYSRVGDRADKPSASIEKEFRQGVHSEFALPFGGRDWRVVFRPRAGWLDGQATSMPLLRSGSLLLLAGLAAGLVHIIGRRTATIRTEVAARTAELAESRRELASMLHALPGMTYRCTYDQQLSVIFVSEGARELTGWTAEEFMSGAAHFRDCIHPDDLGRIRDATRRALEEHSEIEVEYRLRTKSGEEKWVLSRGRGIYGPDGKLGVFEGLAIDITAQKHAEAGRLELERKLLEGQKLESLGLLAGGIAHDFNNLLSAILGNASMARLGLPAGSTLDEPLRAIEAASLRAAELCRQMLAYAGKGRFVVEPTDLSALVEELVPLLKISIKHQATLTLKLDRNLPTVQADATQLRQIVMNLVLNAADAIVDRAGEIVVTSGIMRVEAGYFANCVAGTDLPAGDYVFVEVRDTGTGMTPEVRAKIFDPFFTTKFAGRGLGLAAVLGIVRGHRGALKVESTAGVGSSFRLLLPPAQAAVAVKPPERETSGPWPRAGRVLVIDDEEDVRAVMTAMLKACGFSAKAAADGEAGVAEFRAQGGAYDIVVLDLLMPGMTGEETFRQLRAIKPDQRVLLVSGYNEGEILGRLGGGLRLSYLAKPFTRAVLEQKLRDLLG